MVPARTSPAGLRRFYSQNLVKVITARCEGFYFPFGLQSPLCSWDGHGCGGRTRTCDHQLMRLVSYHCYTPQYGWETGLEPVTSCLTGKRSTLLSYSPLFFCLSNTSNTSSGKTIPASTSLWQFEQSNTHLSNSAFTVSQLLVSPDPIPNSLLDGST